MIGLCRSTSFNVTNLVNNAMAPPRVSPPTPTPTPSPLPAEPTPTPMEPTPTTTTTTIETGPSTTTTSESTITTSTPVPSTPAMPAPPTIPAPPTTTRIPETTTTNIPVTPSTPISPNATIITTTTRNTTAILPTGNLTAFSSNFTMSTMPLMNLNLNDSSIIPALVAALNINTPLNNSTLCPNLNNCNFYGVDTNMTGLSCKACKKEFLMTYDTTGKKDCNTKQPIKNCRKSIKRPDRQNNTAFCFQCMPDYALKDDYSCALVGSVRRISNCQDYLYTNNTVFCNNCKPGFLLDENRKKCSMGCKMTGCDSCKLVKNKEVCIHCKPDTIGVYDSKVDGFTSCMTCTGFKDQIKKKFTSQ
jgi:hypothetical protein